MQVFEFHFNPASDEKHHAGRGQGKGDLIFDSFCYEPENIYEKKAGGLYMAGLLKNTLPHQAGFLGNLAKVIKDRYYKMAISSPEKSLRESLKKANEYLESIAKKGDVSWLGNISFSTLSVAAIAKGYEFNFTKVGDIKIFLLRNGHLIDIDQKLQFEGIEPYPLKIFGNIISGKLLANDVILVFTQEVLGAFQNQNIMSSICQAQSPAGPSQTAGFDAKKLKEILNNKKETLLKIRGLFLAIALNQEAPFKEKGNFTVSQPAGWVSMIDKIRPTKIKIPSFNWRGLPIIHPPALSAKKLREILKLSVSLPVSSRAMDGFSKSKTDLKNIILQKNSGLIFLFITLLILGFFIFQQRERQQIAQYRQQFGQINEKIKKAESYIATAQYNTRSRNQANMLLKELLEEISALVKISPSLPKNLATDAKGLEEKISAKLYELNKLKIISDPKIIFEFDSRGFVPQKMISFQNKIYFFNPFAENISELTLNREGKIESKMLPLSKKTALAAQLSNAVVFFSKSGEFVSFADNNFSTPATLKAPYADFAVSDVIAYYGNFYVLDSANGALVKYPSLGNMQWTDPQIWLKNESVSSIKSITIDSSVWALTIDDKIQRYYAQKLQGNLKFDIFPAPKNFSKIFTAGSLPYLYLSESSQKRIVVLNKSGQIEIQIQSESFDNLLDFAVSENGKTIYILNGLKVYQINL